MRMFAVLGGLLAAMGSARSADVDAHGQHFRDLAETRNYSLGRPIAPRVTPDGRHAIFLRGGSRDPILRLYELELDSGRERELLTPAQLLGSAEETLSAEEKARRERQRQSLRGFTFFELSRDGRRLLVSLSGKLYLVARDTLKVTALPGSGWIDPRFSPDGEFVAAAGADRELHVIDVSAATERAVTRGATPTRSFGTAEFIAQEEMSRSRGFWWSPDSATLLVQETDETDVEVRYIADPLRPEVAPTPFFYPRAGTANAVVRLHLFPRAGGGQRTVEWDRVAFPYLAHVDWSESRAPLTLLVQNRAQTEQRLLAVDVATGATRELLRETDAAWLDLDDNGAGATGERRPPFWYRDGTHFVWSTERRGAWQLELRDARGEFVRELTSAAWTYMGFVGLDEARGHVYVRGGDDPRELHLWRFPLSGGPGVRLTHERGVHGATYFRDGGMLVRTSDAFTGVHQTEVVSAVDGKTVRAIPSVAEVPRVWPTTELLQTETAPRFDAAVTKPRRPGAGKLPVILNVYAGPSSKMVLASIRRFLGDQWFADQGYIVVRVDGRGTPGRGREWARAIKGNLIDVALQDQIAALHTLARQHPEMDLSRVGVMGWSFGGYFAAMATARRPDVFRAGVAGAPVVTWENYDTHYTERYLGHPATNPEAYRASNVTTYAGQLSRPLLLIHGLTDDNVYFQHTLQLAEALYLAGKPYELLPMLGTHMVSEPLIVQRQHERILEFFERTLKR